VAIKRRTKAASKAAEAAEPGPAVPVVAAAPESAPAANVVQASVAAVKLPGGLQIRNADEVANLLRAAIATRELRIDAGDVSQVDTAGVQLLVAAIATARRDGAEHEWLSASPSLRDAARRLGVEALLEMPAVAG
jgi:anti-anti-sigma factor